MFYFVISCDVCEDGEGCNEFQWVKNSEEDGELYETSNEAERAAIEYIGNNPFSYKISEVGDDQ